MDKRHYVYLLRCADGSLYTGMTPDIARRLRQHVEHLAGCAKYTRSHPVTALALLLTTDTATTARQLEARIKRLTRAQKDALIADPAKIADLCPALAGADIRPVPGAALADYLPNTEKPADAQASAGFVLPVVQRRPRSSRERSVSWTTSLMSILPVLTHRS